MAVRRTKFQKVLAESLATRSEEGFTRDEALDVSFQDAQDDETAHIAWLLYSEARGVDVDEMERVADTVVNRQRNSGDSYKDIIYAEGQYADTRYEEMPEGFKRGDYAAAKSDRKRWQEAFTIAGDVIDGRHEVKSHATHMNSTVGLQDTDNWLWGKNGKLELISQQSKTRKDGKLTGHRFGYDKGGRYKAKRGQQPNGSVLPPGPAPSLRGRVANNLTEEESTSLRTRGYEPEL